MQSTSTETLESALVKVDTIKEESRGKNIVFFLDYDGTLTPIVSQPEEALLSSSMKSMLKRLMKEYTVAIISGRDLADVRALVGIDGLFYAASHGFDIAGPNVCFQLPEAVTLIPILDQAEKVLHETFDTVSDVKIERKHFSIATHYRNVQDTEQEQVKNTIIALSSQFPELQIGLGKKVVEMRPRLAWDKGRALLWLVDMLHETPTDTYCIYIGDDITDEDAFKVLGSDGSGIVVRDENRPTFAKYALENTIEVQSFLLEFLSEK